MRSTTKRPFAWAIVLASVASMACGGTHAPKTADGEKSEATKWDSPLASSEAVPAAKKSGDGSLDLDSTSPASASSDVRATIAGKEIVFKQCRIHGNAREGFGLHAFEAASGQAAGKAELNLRLAGGLVRGKPIAVSLTFLQIPDVTANSLRGVRAIDCGGKGKLTLDTLPTVPKETPKDEIDVGEAVGNLSLQVKCVGDAKDYGTFALGGKVSAQVLVTPEQ